MADLDALISARSSNSNAGEKYKDISSQLERDIDPLEAAARKEAASILSLEGVKQFSIQLDAPLHPDDDEDIKIDDLKVRRLLQLHDEMEVPQIIVYVNNQRDSDKLKSDLEKKGKHVSVVSIDVNMLDRARDSVRSRFQNGFDNILIVNDSVPNHRGIEFILFEKQTIFIINYSLPITVPLYSKRIGRRIPTTSKKGVVVNFLSSSRQDHDMVKKLEAFYHTEIKSTSNPHAWKELRYFLHFCP